MTHKRKFDQTAVFSYCDYCYFISAGIYCLDCGKPPEKTCASCGSYWLSKQVGVTLCAGDICYNCGCKDYMEASPEPKGKPSKYIGSYAKMMKEWLVIKKKGSNYFRKYRKLLRRGFSDQEARNMATARVYRKFPLPSPDKDLDILVSNAYIVENHPADEY